MRLRTRLMTTTAVTFGIVFLITALLIFISFYKFTYKASFDSIKSNTLLAAVYYLEKDELSKFEHSSIKETFKTSIPSSMVAVYNESNYVQYGELYNDPILTVQLINQIRHEKKYAFHTPEYFYYGLYYPDNQGDFVVISKQSSAYFKTQVNGLLLIMGIVLLMGLLSIILISKYLSKTAYKPFQDIVNQIKKVDYNNLEHGIAIPHTKDEIEELVKTYNELLARLADGFQIQKNFISYVSHEFKTPLASISGNLEVFGRRDRTPEEYKKVAATALESVYEIQNLLSNLILMSGLKNTREAYTNFRIDELLWNVHDLLQPTIAAKSANIDIQIWVEDVNLLSIFGNEILIQLALFNLVENAIKYSDNKPIAITLSERSGRLKLQISDQGIGISKEDLPIIDKTFFRGKNTQDIKGNGIGLALVKSILDEHQIRYSFSSTLDEGTVVDLYF